MKAISIRQPWAWGIIYAGKNVENRDWFTRVRGRVLVHAAKGMTKDEYEDTCEFFDRIIGKAAPPMAVLQFGGIIGSVEIVDCVQHSESPWFFGKYGFMLRDPKPLPFVPFRGSLGFFEVPDHLMAGAS